MNDLVQLLEQINECKFCLQDAEIDADHFGRLSDSLSSIYTEVAKLKNAACKHCDHCAFGKQREGDSIFCKLKNLEYKRSAKSCDYWVQRSTDF